ncbi:hypothetical protein ABW19_dt0203580 [Dactylella cylindrospora]|nr:hypothetical protein ABW19_dt0203580 [Dactylella cylindrospora]
MKSANFASRKPKARIIASFDDDETDGSPAPSPAPVPMDTTANQDDASASLFKRKSSSTKSRKAVNRSIISLDDPHDEEASADSLELSRPVVVKKSTLTRQAIERSASQSQSQPTTSISTSKERPRTILKPSTSTTLPSQPFSQLSLTSGPSYSKEALAELKTSTPTTPLHRPSTTQDDDTPMLDAESLDVASKFATERSSKPSPLEQSIPDEGTIKAMKARRAMLAQNPDYISLSDKAPKGSRLQRGDDDEEILQTFVEDGGLALGKRAEREKERRRREDIREAIDMVERSDNEGTEDSENGENGEWEADRIRTGGYGSSKRETLEERLKKPPAVITPLPDFGEALARLKGILAGMNQEMEQKAKLVEELASEREMIEQREKEVQEMLRVTSEKYEKLREEAGTAMHVGRGLESFGDDHSGNGTPAAV